MLNTICRFAPAVAEDGAEDGAGAGAEAEAQAEEDRAESCNCGCNTISSLTSCEIR